MIGWFRWPAVCATSCRPKPPNPSGMRTLTSAIVDEMWVTGLMSAFNPVAADGAEPSFPEMIETWIEMAWQDPSFGWIGIANLPSSFAAAAYLPDEGFAEVFTAHDNRVTVSGKFFPNGQGTAVEGGYLLNGSRNFGSGVSHSQYIAAGFRPTDNGEMRWISRRPFRRCASLWFRATRSASTTAGTCGGSREPAPVTTAPRMCSCPLAAPSSCSSGGHTAASRRLRAWG